MGLWRDKNRGDWRYSFERQKKRFAGGGFKTKAEARAARETRRKEIAEGVKATQTGTAFSTVANQYLDWSQKRHAKQTYQYKAMVIREFLANTGDLDIRSITPSIMHSYLSTRPTNHNYNVHRKELCSLFTFAINQLRVIEQSPCWNLEKMPEKTIRKTIPTQEEFLRILAAADPTSEKPLLLCLVHTFARIDELLRLTWEDVNFSQRVVSLWTSKRKGGDMERDDMPMNEELFSVLQSLWKTREQDEWVFYNAKQKNRYIRRPKMMKSICARAGVRPFGFHAIRHFMATYSKDELKLPVGVISRLLRHKSVRTTEIYLHSIDEHSREAMRRLEGVFMLADPACGLDGKEG